jgi:CheY-like chemotaxis protein
MEPIESTFEILIVDDDEGHVELIRRNLRRFGIGNSLIVLEEGARALDYMFRRGEFAAREGADPLILLDINMPGSVNGMEVLRQVKADPQTRKTPIIMLSNSNDSREVSMCYEMGCSMYIAKPADPLQFIEAIRLLGLLLPVIRLESTGHCASAAQAL